LLYPNPKKPFSESVVNQKRKMELWNRARSFAEEAAKRSQELSLGARATQFTNIIAETTKEIAAQASKHLPRPYAINDVDLHRFGITEELRDFVKGITITTFEDFPLQGFFRFILFCVWIRVKCNYMCPLSMNNN